MLHKGSSHARDERTECEKVLTCVSCWKQVSDVQSFVMLVISTETVNSSNIQ